MFGMDKLTSNSVDSFVSAVLRHYQEHSGFLFHFKKHRADFILLSTTLAANFRMPFFFAIRFY